MNTNASPSLADEKYLALTTFKKDGTPKPVPVWPVDAGDGRVGFITSSQTWKVKRMTNNSHVVLQASDGRGRVKEGTEPVSGTAELIAGETFERMDRLVSKKYGIQLKMINLLHALPGKKTGHPNDTAIVVTLDA
jgi:uncharacterized protein